MIDPNDLAGCSRSSTRHPSTRATRLVEEQLSAGADPELPAELADIIACELRRRGAPDEAMRRDERRLALIV